LKAHTEYSRPETALWLPLGFWDLSLWTAIVAIILLITSELLSPYYGRTGIVLNRRRLRAVALVTGLFFLSTVAYAIYEIVK
jgi:hypothetical protein